jgi:hypothetical protein
VRRHRSMVIVASQLGDPSDHSGHQTTGSWRLLAIATTGEVGWIPAAIVWFEGVPTVFGDLAGCVSFSL